MKVVNIAEELSSNAYPGRGIILGKTPDGKKAAIAYFIMAEAKTAATVFLRLMTGAESVPRLLMNQR